MMQAGPEHALVLIPNAGADYCSFIATYMVLVDSRRTAPSLTLSMQNPRFLVLFRFVADIMDAVGIIGSALTRTKAAGTKQPAPGPQVSGSPQKAAAGASSGAGAGADGASPAPRTGATGSADLLVDKPLEFVVQLQNVGIVVPTGETTRTVLSGQLEQLTFAMPGHALPPTMLQKAALPGLDTMLAESLLSNMTFKFSGFHDAPPSQAAPPVPKAVSPTEAEKEAEARAAAQHPPAATDAPSQPTSPRPEGAPDGPKGSSPSIKRRGMFGGRQRARRREPGVLFFEDEEEDPRINLAGVLHVGPEDEHAQEGQSGGANVDLEDNMLAAPQAIAKHVVGATKKLVTNVVEKFDQDGTGRASSQLRQPVIIPNQPRPESRESGTSAGSGAPKGSVAPGSSGDGKGGAFGAVGLANGAPRPQALLAICVEKFSVVTGSLVRVPNYFRHVSPQPPCFVVLLFANPFS